MAVLALLAGKICGYTAASLLAGRRLSRAFGHTGSWAVGREIVLGTALFLVVGSIPMVGSLLDLAVTAFRFGAVALTGFGGGPPCLRRPPAPA